MTGTGDKEPVCAHCGGPVLFRDAAGLERARALKYVYCSSRCMREHGRELDRARDRPRGLEVPDGEWLRAIRWQFERLDTEGWHNPEAVGTWVAIYYLIDALPPRLQPRVIGDMGFPTRMWRRMRRNAARYIRGAQRERWPAWKRVLLPLGPARPARMRFYARHAYIDSSRRCLGFDR